MQVRFPPRLPASFPIFNQLITSSLRRAFFLYRGILGISFTVLFTDFNSSNTKISLPIFKRQKFDSWSKSNFCQCAFDSFLVNHFLISQFSTALEKSATSIGCLLVIMLPSTTTGSSVIVPPAFLRSTCIFQ